MDGSGGEVSSVDDIAIYEGAIPSVADDPVSIAKGGADRVTPGGRRDRDYTENMRPTSLTGWE